MSKLKFPAMFKQEADRLGWKKGKSVSREKCYLYTSMYSAGGGTITYRIARLPKERGLKLYDLRRNTMSTTSLLKKLTLPEVLYLMNEITQADRAFRKLMITPNWD